MSTDSDAIEAAARAFTDAHNNAVDRDYEYGIPFVSDDDQTAAIAGIRAAAPILEANVRAKIAEETARRGQAILRDLLQDHLLTNGKCYPHLCGDPGDVIWSEHIAELWHERTTADSHASNADLPGEQEREGVNGGPRNAVEPRTGVATSNDTNDTPKPAQTV